MPAKSAKKKRIVNICCTVFLVKFAKTQVGLLTASVLKFKERTIFSIQERLSHGTILATLVYPSVLSSIKLFTASLCTGALKKQRPFIITLTLLFSLSVNLSVYPSVTLFGSWENSRTAYAGILKRYFRIMLLIIQRCLLKICTCSEIVVKII